MSPLLGGFVLFALTTFGSYVQVETFRSKTECNLKLKQEVLKHRKQHQFDLDGHSHENGLPAFLCVRQKGATLHKK